MSCVCHLLGWNGALLLGCLSVSACAAGMADDLDLHAMLEAPYSKKVGHLPQFTVLKTRASFDADILS